MGAVGVAGWAELRRARRPCGRGRRRPTLTLPDQVRVAGEHVVREPEDDHVAVGDLRADPGSRSGPGLSGIQSTASTTFPFAHRQQGRSVARIAGEDSPGPRTPRGTDRRASSVDANRLPLRNRPLTQAASSGGAHDDRRPAWSLERRRDPSGGPVDAGACALVLATRRRHAAPARSRPWSCTIRLAAHRDPPPSGPGRRTPRTRAAGRLRGRRRAHRRDRLAQRVAVSSASTPPPPRRTSIDWIVALTGKPLIRRRSYWTCTRPSTPERGVETTSWITA